MIAIINPSENYNLDTLRTLIVNVKLAVEDLYLVENRVDKNKLIKSGAIFIDESQISQIIKNSERKLIFEKITDSLLHVDYVEIVSEEKNGIFKTHDNSFKLTSSKEEEDVFDAPIGVDMTCQIKLTLNRDRRFYGPGTSLLLKLIDRTQSVKSAAISMNISYSKALQMIRTVEKGLGFQVVEKKQGGTGGGESFLTEEGREFVRKYDRFHKEVSECVREIFERYW